MITNIKYIKGFTLVEMLISIIILSLVTSSMFLLFNNVQKKFSYNRTVSDLNSYAKGVFLYLDETISAAQGNDIVQDGNGNYRIDFTNIHNEWYNGNGDYFVDQDKCNLEDGCVVYSTCREICEDIPISWNKQEGVKFNNIPIWKYADFRGIAFANNDPTKHRAGVADDKSQLVVVETLAHWVERGHQPGQLCSEHSMFGFR